MTLLHRINSAAALLAVAACSGEPAQPTPLTDSAWTLDGDASTLSYVSIKAGEIAETNTFETLGGGVAQDGTTTVTIDLASVSTGVDIRDERMREIFFVVADNPEATITATIDPASFEALGVGESTQTSLEGTLSLKGVEAPVAAQVTVTRSGEDRILAVADAPVIVNAASFELMDELAQLQELAGLPSITPVVPVTFALTFER